ncbi:hypothetical protein [Halomicrobium salinisoli]|uniref:hypothetical protein n=1 Tax=Halomicrobium salinisoli TaxID=2878391 RepID=UPI001CF03FF7|nr:hypothetical protein [Halomicrobium salinisoli]
MSFEDTVAESFADAGADAETAETAAERVAAFREDYEIDLPAEDVADRVESAPYDDFAHAYDWLVGDLAADVDDCTDSREYRLEGFGDLAADPEQGA